MSDKNPLPPWRFAELEEAVDKVMRQVAGLKLWQPRQIKWTGPLLTTKRILCGSPNIDELLTESSLAYAKERGRDVMTVLIGIAIQLGYENGLREAAADKAEFVDNLLAQIELLSHVVNSGGSL